MRTPLKLTEIDPFIVANAAEYFHDLSTSGNQNCTWDDLAENVKVVWVASYLLLFRAFAESRGAFDPLWSEPSQTLN